MAQSQSVKPVSTENELEKKKTEFISIASHQLRTPLGSIRWNLEMLLQGLYGPIPKEIEEVLRQIYQSDLKMISLVNNLLSASRIDQGRIFDEPVATDIEQVIREVAAEIEIEAQKKLIIGELQFPKEKLPPIVIDSNRLREVIKNLLSNAIRYNRKNGKVIVQVEAQPDCAAISVTDNGIGIPENAKENIFGKYYRAENAVNTTSEGTGLGLYIIKSYVEGWGGKVWFDSKQNEGTTFRLTIPFQPKQIHNTI